MPKGTIRKVMDRGFGFIKTEEGKDLFFHRSEIEGVEFFSLKVGQEVEFEIGQRQKRSSAGSKGEAYRDSGTRTTSLSIGRAGITKSSRIGITVIQNSVGANTTTNHRIGSTTEPNAEAVRKGKGSKRNNNTHSIWRGY